MNAVAVAPSNNELQRTSDGNAAGSPLNSVLAGQMEQKDTLGEGEAFGFKAGVSRRLQGRKGSAAPVYFKGRVTRASMVGLIALEWRGEQLGASQPLQGLQASRHACNLWVRDEERSRVSCRTRNSSGNVHGMAGSERPANNGFKLTSTAWQAGAALAA